MPLLTKGIFVLGGLLFYDAVMAQHNEPLIDSIRFSFSSRPKIDIKADARTSFITTKPARIFGIKVGLDFNSKVKVGLGYNWLISEIKKDRNIVVDGNIEKIDSRLILRYISPYFEYTYYSSPKLELSIPVMVGFGFSRYTPADTFYKFLPDSDRRFVMFYEPYSIGLYKPIPWVGLGFGVGYRLLFFGNSGISENLNSPIYVLKGKVLLGVLYRSLKSKIK